jgi:hypothetical protein
MDADLSHNPDDVPKLIMNVKKADLAIGSRYCNASMSLTGRSNA